MLGIVRGVASRNLTDAGRKDCFPFRHQLQIQGSAGLEGGAQEKHAVSD